LTDSYLAKLGFQLESSSEMLQQDVSK